MVNITDFDLLLTGRENAGFSCAMAFGSDIE